MLVFFVRGCAPQELEDGVDRKGGNEGFEEKISQALFNEDVDEANKEAIKTADIVSDAFTTEVRQEPGWGLGWLSMWFAGGQGRRTGADTGRLWPRLSGSVFG